MHGRRAESLDLIEVSLVDREPVRLLGNSEAGGIELRNCPAYMREWIGGERYLTLRPEGQNTETTNVR